MGRRKILIAPITSDRNRSVTYVKRKAGLFKKAHELAVLTDASIAVIVFGHNGKLSEFCSGDIDRLLLRYTEYNGPVERKGPDNYGAEEEGDDEEDDAEGGGAGAAGGSGADHSSSTAGPSHSGGGGGGANGGASNSSYPGAGATRVKIEEADQDVQTSSSSKAKKNSKDPTGSCNSPDKASAPVPRKFRNSKKISGKRASEKGTHDEASNASGSESETDPSAAVRAEAGGADISGGKINTASQPRQEPEQRDAKDALKAAIRSRGAAKAEASTNPNLPTKIASEFPDPQHQRQQSHLRHVSEGSNSHQTSVPELSSAGPHRQMQASSSFSGPFGFTPSASPVPQFQGVSPDLQAVGLASQRPFTAHGTGAAMNQYQHMMGGNNGSVSGAHNLRPNSNFSYAYLQSGGYDGSAGSVNPSTRPITAHGTGQSVPYPSQPPFPSSTHPSSQDQSYPLNASYSDLSGSVTGNNAQLYHQGQPHGMSKGYANVNVNYRPVGNAGYFPQGSYPQQRPVSQGGIPQSQSLQHLQPPAPVPSPSSAHVGYYPLTHSTTPNQYQDQSQSLQVQQLPQGRTSQTPISQSQQQSRPSSRGGPMPSSDGSPSPFSHHSAAIVPPQIQNSPAQLGNISSGVPNHGSSTLMSPSADLSGSLHARDAEESRAPTFAGQKRKSFELDDVTLGALASSSSSNLSMSNFRYDLSTSGDLGHSSKLARPNTSGGFSRDNSSLSMFESSGLVGGRSLGGTETNHGGGRLDSSHSNSSSFARPSTSGYTSSSSSSSLGSLSTMPGLRDTSDADGESSQRRGGDKTHVSSATTAFNDLVGSFLEPGISATPVINHHSPSRAGLESPNFTLHSRSVGSSQIHPHVNINHSKLDHHLDLVNHHDGTQRSPFDDSGLTTLGSN